jgi:hypothetical protein
LGSFTCQKLFEELLPTSIKVVPAVKLVTTLKLLPGPERQFEFPVMANVGASP